jgi:hypothetical protein
MELLILYVSEVITASVEGRLPFNVRILISMLHVMLGREEYRKVLASACHAMRW